MKLVPLDIENKTFRRSLFGYSTREVDEFMDQVYHDYEALYKENFELRKKIEGIEERIARYEEIKGNMERALVVAQKSAEEVTKQAHQQASLILQEARLEAEKMHHELSSLRQEKDRFSVEFQTLLETYLKLLHHNGKEPV